jgi:hypothetical protein
MKYTKKKKNDGDCGDSDDDNDNLTDVIQQVQEIDPRTSNKLLIWVPHLKKYMHRAAVVADIAMGGGKHYLSADRGIRAKATKKKQDDGQEEVEPDLQHDEWVVGIGTDIAAKIGDHIEVGRVLRITRRGNKKDKIKGADYKHPVRLSSKEDREKEEKKGIRFHCHWFIKPKRNQQKNIYTFSENPFSVKDLGPQNIVSPVVVEYIKDKKWKMSEQSMKIIQTQQRGRNNIWVGTLNI